MKYLAAALLLGLGRDPTISAGGIEKILGSVGIEPDQERLKLLVSQLKGKNVDELITEGKMKMATFAPAAPTSGATASVAPVAAAEEEKEEPKEESDDDLGFGLFD